MGKSTLKLLACDTETTGLNSWTGDRPFAVSFCDQDGRTGYVEVPVDPFTRKPQWTEEKKNKVRRRFKRRGYRFPFFNLKFDKRMLEAVGVDVPFDRCDEVTFMVKACDNLRPSYKLKQIAAEEPLCIPNDDEADLKTIVKRCRLRAKKLGWYIATKEEFGDQYTNADYWIPSNLARLHPELFKDEDELRLAKTACKKYAIRDAERTVRLAELYLEGIEALGVEDTYRFELELLPLTYSLESHGLRILPDELRRAKSRCIKAVKRCKKLIASLTHEDFNPNSPAQLVEELYVKRKLPVKRMTKGGPNKPAQPSTAADVLYEFKDDALVNALLELQAKSKGLKDFFKKYERMAVRGKYWVLHPSLNQWGTKTGRYSASNPNLQNVSNPATSRSKLVEWMPNVRSIFGPRDGHVWYCPDYSQVEVVIFADVVNEKTMLKAIRNGAKIHEWTTDRIWGGKNNPRGIEAAMQLLETDSVQLAKDALADFNWSLYELEVSLDKKQFKNTAKSVTFTKTFGGGPNALMKWLNCGRAYANEMLNAYDEAFPDITKNMNELKTRGKLDGYVYNKFGRRLCVDPWNAYRVVNHLVQSAAADLMKRGMMNCNTYLQKIGIDAKIILTVHDEIIFEVRKGHDTKPVLKKLCAIMADHGGAFSVPISVAMDRVDKQWSHGTKVEL